MSKVRGQEKKHRDKSNEHPLPESTFWMPGEPQPGNDSPQSNNGDQDRSLDLDWGAENAKFDHGCSLSSENETGWARMDGQLSCVSTTSVRDVVSRCHEALSRFCPDACPDCAEEEGKLALRASVER